MKKTNIHCTEGGRGKEHKVDVGIMKYCCSFLGNGLSYIEC